MPDAGDEGIRKRSSLAFAGREIIWVYFFVQLGLHEEGLIRLSGNGRYSARGGGFVLEVEEDCGGVERTDGERGRLCTQEQWEEERCEGLRVVTVVLIFGNVPRLFSAAARSPSMEGCGRAWLQVASSLWLSSLLPPFSGRTPDCDLISFSRELLTLLWNVRRLRGIFGVNASMRS